MLSIPKKDLVWVVRAMASTHNMDPDQLERFVELLTGFSRDYCGPYSRGLMAVHIRFVKMFKLREKAINEWRQNVGLGFQILDKLRGMFGGDLAKAMAAYYLGSCDPVSAAVRKGVRQWREHLNEEAQLILRRVEVGSD